MIQFLNNIYLGGEYQKHIGKKEVHMTIDEWNKLSNKQKLHIVEHRFLNENEIEAFCEDKEMWSFMSYYQRMSEAFINKHKEDVDWKYISAKGPFSKDFILKNINKLQFNIYLSNNEIKEDFLRELIPFLTKDAWFNIFKFWDHTVDFVREFLPKVDWYAYSDMKELTEKEMEEFKDNIAWRRIAPQCITEKIMDRFFNELNWYDISRVKTFSNIEADRKFIEKYQGYLFFPNIDMSIYDRKFRRKMRRIQKHRDEIREKFEQVL